MKKTVIASVIFLLTAITTSYAGGIYTSQTTSSDQYSGGIFSNSPSPSEVDSGCGLFRTSPANPSSPGTDRPGNGGGIGQGAPIGDGLIVMITCCVLLIAGKALVKGVKRKSILKRQTQD